MNMPASLTKPVHKKVAAGGVGSLASVVILWVLSNFVEVPPEVASAITGLVTFGCGYLKAE